VSRPGRGQRVIAGFTGPRHRRPAAGLIDPAARTRTRPMPPRPPAAGTPEGMNAAASLPRTRPAHGAPHITHNRSRPLSSMRREEDRPPGRSSSRALHLDPGPFPGMPKTGPATPRKRAHQPLDPGPLLQGCKTVGSAFDGSNPSPATTSENGPRPGVSPGSRAVVRCVILGHLRSGDAAAPRWLRTYGGRIRGWRSGSPHRLLGLRGPSLLAARPARSAENASPQRVRHHFRRPVPGRRDLLTQPPETPFVG
jgi:hypothetical protein